MTYCLIDNCSLINLLSKDGGLEDINTLKYWQEQDALKILLPETVKEEWDEHKEKQRKKLEQSLNTKIRHTKEVLRKASLNLPSTHLENEFNIIEDKINAIDELLKYSKTISITSHVKSLIPDRQIRKKGIRKAPFHNKVDSVKDAYIIFSTLEYLSEKQINELLFISENKNDFGDPKNKTRTIHPDISDDYPSIQIDYYSDIFYALSDYKNKMPFLQKELSHDSIEEGIFFSDKDDIYINRSIKPLDQLYNYLRIRFDEIKVLPAHLFTKNYPFDRTGNSYRNDFTLKNINGDIVELLKRFEIQQGKLVNDFKSASSFKKALYILKTFSRNNIFNVHGRKREDFLNIRVFYKDEPDLTDKLEQFKFVEVYKAIKYESFDDIDKNLEVGYFFYKIGDLLKSKDYFLKAKELARIDSKEIIELICNHNLYHLGMSIEFRYWRLENRDEIVKELKQINIGATKVPLHNSKIKEYIVNGSFFTNPQIKLQSLTNEIVDTYQSYLRGGRSSNNFNWEVYYQYELLYQFLNKNYIVYEHYSDYYDIINSLVESIFASYAIKNGDNRINALDDYTLLHFVLYAKTKDLEKYYKRYYLSEIEYDKSEESENSIITLFANFLSNNVEELKELLKKLPEQVGDKFWENYTEYFKNFLFLHSILKLSDNHIKTISKVLIDYLNENLYWLSKRPDYVNKYIYHFFIRQQEPIRPSVIKKVLFLSYKHPDFFSEHLCLELVGNSLDYKPLIKITDLQLSKVILPFIKNRLYEKKGQLNPHNYIVHINVLLNTNQKKELLNYYKQILEKENNHYLFYILVIYDVVDINCRKFLNNYIDSIDLKNKKALKSRSFLRRTSVERYEKIDNLLNMWFKYDLSLTDKRVKPFEKVNDYYNWLLNLDGFDYDKFDSEWLSEYGTRFYFEHFKKSKTLKGKIKSLLHKDFDIALKKVYCDIYN